ncbi:hypothetical protein BC826DRAFT_966439 [Russula brevipes]|nr:hypothetical protein BC826DRAFT_966439 [Russula brevipes]
MSAVRAAAATAKHTRTLSRPLRRTFYSPFAALQRSPLLTKQTPTTTAAAVATSSDAVSQTHEHEHEREHAARTLYVVSEPNAAEFKYGVPAGAYPNAAPYHPVAAAPPKNWRRVRALRRARPSLSLLPGACALEGEGGMEEEVEMEATTWPVGGRSDPPRLSSRNLPAIRIQECGDEMGRVGIGEAWERRM